MERRQAVIQPEITHKADAQRVSHSRESGNTHAEHPRIPKRRARPALDLTEEAKKARLHGDAYLPDFLKQMRSFAKETDSTGRLFSYEHIVQRDSDGTARLYITEGGVLMPARKSYLRPALDPALPKWDRERHYREYQAICAMEDMLSHSTPQVNQDHNGTRHHDFEPKSIEYPRAKIRAGESIVEASPAPFDVDESELDGTFYGAFSFFRIHTLTHDEQGREVLAGRQVLHYLDWETQEELYAALTGRNDVPKEELLGTVSRLEPGDGYKGIKTIEDVALLIGDIDNKHKLEADEDAGTRSEEEIDAFLLELDVIAQDVFRLIKDRAPKQRVMDLVRDYRQLMRDYCAGSDKAREVLSEYKASRGEKVVSAAYGGYAFAERYNSCGVGVGYDDYGPAPYSDAVRFDGRASFVRFAEYVARANSLPKDLRIVRCPGSGKGECGKPVIFSRRDVMRLKKLACPCGACASGCNAEAIADKARAISRQDALRFANTAYFFKAA